MRTGTGIAIIGVAMGVLIFTALILRRRIPQRGTDALAAACGVAVGVGGLLLFHRDVSLASWIAAPTVLAIGSVAHIRVLFGGAGPFRT
jgi:hypothetical protein